MARKGDAERVLFGECHDGERCCNGVSVLLTEGVAAARERAGDVCSCSSEKAKNRTRTTTFCWERTVPRGEEKTTASGCSDSNDVITSPSRSPDLAASPNGLACTISMPTAGSLHLATVRPISETPVLSITSRYSTLVSLGGPRLRDGLAIARATPGASTSVSPPEFSLASLFWEKPYMYAVNTFVKLVGHSIIR